MKALPHPLSPDVRPLTLRDLTWLTASLAIVIVPHALRAPWWLTLLTLCLYGWRFYSMLTRAPLPSRWLVIAVAATVALVGLRARDGWYALVVVPFTLAALGWFQARERT